MNITYSGTRFVATDNLAYAARLHDCGWKYDGVGKTWWFGASGDVATHLAVSGFRDYMDGAARQQAAAIAAAINRQVAWSAATRPDPTLPALPVLPAPAGCSYLPHQVAGIAFMLKQRDVLLGDERGLGRATQLVGLANADPAIASVLVVCPPSRKQHWQDEFARWCTRDWRVAVVGNKRRPAGDAQVMVVSYNQLYGYRGTLGARDWGLLIFDDARYLKSRHSRRFAAVFGRSEYQARWRLYKQHAHPAGQPEALDWPEAKRRLDDVLVGNPALKAELQQLVWPGLRGHRRVFVTDTPVPRRPVDIFSLLQRLDPRGLGADYRAFVDRYCAPTRKYGRIIADGASHLDELWWRLRATCLLCRRGEDVLPRRPNAGPQLLTTESADIPWAAARGPAPAAALGDRQVLASHR